MRLSCMNAHARPSPSFEGRHGASRVPAARPRLTWATSALFRRVMRAGPCRVKSPCSAMSRSSPMLRAPCDSPRTASSRLARVENSRRLDARCDARGLSADTALVAAGAEAGPAAASAIAVAC